MRSSIGRAALSEVRSFVVRMADATLICFCSVPPLDSPSRDPPLASHGIVAALPITRLSSTCPAVWPSTWERE